MEAGTTRTSSLRRRRVRAVITGVAFFFPGFVFSLPVACAFANHYYAGEAQAITVRPAEMIINIDQKGHYFIGDQPASLHELNLALHNAWVMRVETVTLAGIGTSQLGCFGATRALSAVPNDPVKTVRSRARFSSKLVRRCSDNGRP